MILKDDITGFYIGLDYYLEDIVLMSGDLSSLVEVYSILLTPGQGYGSVSIKPMHPQVEKSRFTPG